MQIPFPDRIPIWYVCVFAGFLFALQMVQGGDPLVCLCCLCFVITAGIAFNIAGGLTRPSGSYVFFFALLAVIVGLVMKIILWEPVQSNLHDPVLTFEAYAVGMGALLVAAYLSRRFSRREGILQASVTTGNMRMAAIGCVVAGIGIPYLGQFANSGGENIFTPIISATNQLNRFLAMAIILGVTYEVKSSGGRRSLNIWVVLSVVWIFFQGAILNFSKEALFLPPVCWLAACAALRYRFRPYQLVTGLVFLVFVTRYMVPYCQYGRTFRVDGASLSENVAVSRGLLEDLPEVRRIYLAQQGDVGGTESKVYYNHSQGLFDRLQMVSMDDALHEVTVQKGPLGMSIMYAYALNFIPHVIWKSKPNLAMANFYGHEIGIIAEADDGTSISFSPIGEAFRIEGWRGVILVAPLVWFCLFFLMDSLCGDLRKSPWGILALASFAHVAPEGGLGGAMYLMFYGSFVICFVAFFSAYVMPIVASLVAPPKRTISPFARPRSREAVTTATPFAAKPEIPGAGL